MLSEIAMQKGIYKLRAWKDCGLKCSDSEDLFLNFLPGKQCDVPYEL